MGKLEHNVNFGNLLYHFKDSTKRIDFNDFIDAETPFNSIELKKIRFEAVEKNQMESKSKLTLFAQTFFYNFFFSLC